VSATLANSLRAILGIAHLYNAVHQTVALTTRWDDLDKVIELHMRQLFAGEFPKSPKEMYTRFMTRTGTSASTFARNLGGRQKERSDQFSIKNHAWIETTAISDILSGYFDGSDSVQRFVFRMEGLSIRDTKPTSKALISKRHLTPLETLAQLQE
jgi:hypothetical protein